MAIDLNRLSAKELEALIAQAKKRRDTLSKRKPIATVRSKLTQLARAEGYTITELFGGAPAPAKATAKKPRTTTKGRKLGAVAPKYRNPANPKETWTGRGKQPRWLATETAKGRKLDEFLIR
jgi:DNA-binding protein H-NS